jgi:hypothetical protein
MAMTLETQDALKETVEELRAARETARLKLHLLSLDAKEAWKEVEARFQETETALSERSDHAAEAAARAARDLARFVRKFLEKHI